MKVSKPKRRGGYRENMRRGSGTPKQLLGGLFALLASGCFATKEQFLGSFGGTADAAVSSRPDPGPTAPEAVDGGSGIVPFVTADPDRPDAGSPTQEKPDCTVGLMPSSQMRFLTQHQYDRTIRDLLGVTQLTAYDNHPPSWLLAPDPAAPEVTALGWAAYQLAARAIAEQVMTEPELRSRFIGCDLAQRDSCLRTTVVEFGRRAFRRPLTDSELDGFAHLLTAGMDLPAEEAAQILLETFLQSPSFLVRAELNQEQPSPGVYALSSYEVATRLSYLLWGTMPDERLQAAADSGQLATAEGVLAEAQRMVGDARASDMVDDFVAQYLHIAPDGVWNVAKDETLFPEYTQGVRDAMTLETLRFFELVVLGGGTFADLFQSPVAFVNVDTAPLYGLSASDFGPDLKQVELLERPGFLSRIGFLSAYSAHTRTSPIRRGAFITKLLGYGLAPIEDAVSTVVPGLDEADTPRQRAELQTANDLCMACHQIINPPGFVLEAFDAIGRPQTTDSVTGAPIDTSVEWSIDGETVALTSVPELMQVLAQSSQARMEYARRWVSFAFELSSVDDHCDAPTLAQALAVDGYTLLNLLMDLTQSPQFLSRTQETP